MIGQKLRVALLGLRLLAIVPASDAARIVRARAPLRLHARGLAAGAAAGLLLLLALDDAVRDRLHVPLDRRERRAQLVRDAHQEVALVHARLLQAARHLLETQRELAELMQRLRRYDQELIAS